MTMRKELEIIIRPDGNVEIVTVGIKGAACLDEVKPIQQALGHVIDQRLTGEYYEEEQSVQLEGRTDTGYPHRDRP